MIAQRNERRPLSLRVGGLTPLSASDWPGQLAAVVFCQGCPWRCGYCHNPHLLPARGATEITWDDVLAFLRRRAGLLDGVVFSGGEPLAQTALANAMRDVRLSGLRVGLHTAGANPGRLAKVLPLVDWVALDIKGPIGHYASITGAPGSGADAMTSAGLIIASGVAYEVRTTVHPRQLSADTVAHLVDDLVHIGVRHYALQEYRAAGCADVALAADVSPSFLSEPYCAAIADRFASFEVRRAA